jgi:hypothetical protein
VRRVVRRKRDRAVRHLPKQQAKRVDVAALVVDGRVRIGRQVALREDLRCHVPRRANGARVPEVPAIRGRLARLLGHGQCQRSQRRGEPKVGHLGVLQLVEHHVGRLDVAVHELPSVQVLEADRRLLHDPEPEPALERV